MEAKALLIPIAAFALSATGVSAFNSQILEKAGLSQDQISAFETAKDLQKEGDKEKAREVLQEAGIDVETMESVREAMYEYRHTMKTAIDRAVEAEDYNAFREAIDDSPLADIITSEEDFLRFSQAHLLHKEGDHKAARELMEAYGLEHAHFRHAFGDALHHPAHIHELRHKR